MERFIKGSMPVFVNASHTSPSIPWLMCLPASIRSSSRCPAGVARLSITGLAEFFQRASSLKRCSCIFSRASISAFMAPSVAW